MHRERPKLEVQFLAPKQWVQVLHPRLWKESAPRQPRTWELPEAGTPPREGAKPFLQAERRAGEKKKIKKGGERANHLHESTEKG